MMTIGAVELYAHTIDPLVREYVATHP